MNRLFGKSKKQSITQFHEQPDNSGEEDSGFNVVATPEQPAIASTPNINAPYGYSQQIITSAPYAVGGDKPQAPAAATPPVHYLEGIPFELGGGSGENDLDAILARAEAASERIKSINWGAYEYDFGLEKSVIEQDITATMKRHGYMIKRNGT